MAVRLAAQLGSRHPQPRGAVKPMDLHARPRRNEHGMNEMNERMWKITWVERVLLTVWILASVALIIWLTDTPSELAHEINNLIPIF